MIDSLLSITRASPSVGRAGLSHLTRSKPQSAPSPLVGEGWGGGYLFDSADLIPPSRLARRAREPTSPTSKSDVSDLDQSWNGRTREHPSSVGEVTETPRTVQTTADRPDRRR